MTNSASEHFSSARLGIFVDGAYVSLRGGHGMRYDVLREFATRDGADPVRMNVYVSLDPDRFAEDGGYRRGQENFCAVLRDFGYKVVQRKMRWTLDEVGSRCARSSVPMDLAVDALRQCENLERVLLVAGDEDYVGLVRALQTRGVRVEVVGFDDAAPALREEADSYFSGYLLPNLLPIPDQPDRALWGELGSRARGVCYSHSGKGYGFLRFIHHTTPALWITDSRHPDSPYETVFFHDSQLPRNVSYRELPSRNIVFEFQIAKSDKFEDDVQATHLRVVAGGGRGREAAAEETEAARPGRETETPAYGAETPEAAWEDEIDSLDDEEIEEIGAEDDRR